MARVQVDLKSYEIQEKMRLERLQRYSTQSVAKMVLKNERVAICLRNRLGDYVGVHKHKQSKKAFYSGLMVCGSVWACPVCAAKISERRRDELKKAFGQWKEQGGKIAMLTLTFSHKKTDKLTDTLKNFTDATKRLFSGKRYNNIRHLMDLVGRIRVFEVTYGANGFHPHVHIALLYRNEIDLKLIKKELYDLWKTACKKYGLKSNKKYGLDLQDASKVEEYLSKHGTWSIEQELSKAHIKVAKNDSMTPFDFLRYYQHEQDSRYLFLFKEYYECFKGRRQIQWSPGLKQMFDLEEKTDVEVATEKIEEADLLGQLDSFEWQLIIRHDLRGELLNNVELYGYIDGLERTLKKVSSWGEDTQELKK